METTRDDDDDGVEAHNKRSEDVDDTPPPSLLGAFLRRRRKRLVVLRAVFDFFFVEKRFYRVFGVGGERNRKQYSRHIPRDGEDKERSRSRRIEELDDAFEGLPGYAPPGVDVMLMAVPKAKVTPSRKKRRNQFKRVEFVRDARKCPTCRKPMRSWHNFCCPPKDDEKEDVVYSTTE